MTLTLTVVPKLRYIVGQPKHYNTYNLLRLTILSSSLIGNESGTGGNYHLHEPSGWKLVLQKKEKVQNLPKSTEKH